MTARSRTPSIAASASRVWADLPHRPQLETQGLQAKPSRPLRPLPVVVSAPWNIAGTKRTRRRSPPNNVAGSDELALLVYLSNLIGARRHADAAGRRQQLDQASRARLRGPRGRRAVGQGQRHRPRTIGRGGFTTLRLDDLASCAAREHVRRGDDGVHARLHARRAEPAPSVETPLHALLPHRYIVHTHDFATQALTDTPRPEALVREVLGDDVAYVDYVRPGFPLARAVIDSARSPRRARPRAGAARPGRVGRHAKACYDNLHLLINRRGVHRRSPRGAARRRRRRSRSPPPPPERRRELARAILPVLRGRLSRERARDPAPRRQPRGAGVRRRRARRRARGARHVDARAHPALRAPPAVRRRRPAGAGARPGQRRDRRRARISSPRATARRSRAPDRGRDAAARAARRAAARPGPRHGDEGQGQRRARQPLLRHGARVMEAAEALGGFQFLDEADGLAFEYWSLELAKLKQADRELGGHVALITGAASGIGRAIAERFAEEGAHVVLTDIDGPALRETAAAIGARAARPSASSPSTPTPPAPTRPTRVDRGRARVRRRRHPRVQRRLRRPAPSTDVARRRGIATSTSTSRGTSSPCARRSAP